MEKYIEIVNWVMLLQHEEIIKVLAKIDHTGDFQGVSKTVLALSLVTWILHYGLHLETLKKYLNEK